MANDLILQLKKLELNKFSGSLATSKPCSNDMSAAILQAICAFCFSKCLTYMSTQGETRAQPPLDLLSFWEALLTRSRQSLQGPPFPLQKPGLIVADQLPPISSSTQYPLSVIHTHRLGWAQIYVPVVRTPFLVFPHSSPFWKLVLPWLSYSLLRPGADHSHSSRVIWDWEE